jgi:hypothetical protein
MEGRTRVHHGIESVYNDEEFWRYQATSLTAFASAATSGIHDVTDEIARRAC